MPAIPQIKMQRLPTYGGDDTVLNGRFCKWGDGDWAAIEWTLPKQLSLTSALVSVKDWQPGDVGFTTVANPGAMWAHAEAALAGATEIDLGPNALIDVGVLQGGDPLGFTIADLYNPDHPAVQSDVWIEVWRGTGTYPTDMKRTKNPGLVERRQVTEVNGSVLTLGDALADPIGDYSLGQWDTILIPEYSTGFSPDTGCVNPFLEGAEKTKQDDLDSRHLSGGMYFVGGGGDMVRLGSPDRSEATTPIPAGLCLCIRVYGAADTGGQVERQLGLTFEMRGVDESPL